MNYFEQRAYIKGRIAFNLTAVAIHSELVTVHGDDAFSQRTTAKWIDRFKSGRVLIEDDPCSGCPVTETTQQNIDRVEQLIDDDPHISYDEVKELTCFSRGTLETTLSQTFDGFPPSNV